MEGSKIAFWFVSGLVIAGGLGVLFSKSIMKAAFSLLVSLIGVGGLFLLSGALFIAAAQIMIYVGGISVLVIFSIMLTKQSESGLIYSKRTLVFGFALFIGFVFLIHHYVIDQVSTNVMAVNQNDVDFLGVSFLSKDLFIFEMVGVLLLFSLIGAVLIASNIKTSSK